MTCKDCKLRFQCSDMNKSYEYADDGDSWANWCDDFISKHKTKTVHYKGFTATQSSVNMHIIIVSDTNEKAWCHFDCEKRLSRRKLKKHIKLFLAMLQSYEDGVKTWT